MRGPFRFDLHVHSGRSHDGKGTPLEIAEAAALAGLTGFALTDHDAVWQPEELEEAQAHTGQLVIPGCEVSTLEGHLLAYGVTEPLPKGASVVDTLEAIAVQGGVAAPAHPLRSLTGLGPSRLRSHAATGAVHLCEGKNGRERRLVQDNTARMVEGLGLAAIGGSDAHWITDVGTAWTAFPQRPRDVSSFLEMLSAADIGTGGGTIRRRKVWAHSASIPFRKRRDHE